MIPPTVLDPVFVELFDDDRISGLAECLLGSDCLYLGISNGMTWNRPTAWHCDHGTTLRRDLKIVMYLDPLTEQDGCLVVLPGSHHDDYHRAVRDAVAGGLHDGHGLPGAHALPTRPGDVQVFNRALWHCTAGPTSPRRQISFTFHAGPGSEHPADRWHESYVAGVAVRAPSWQAGYRLYGGRLRRVGNQAVSRAPAEPRRL